MSAGGVYYVYFERVVQSILYEVGCILIGCLVMLFVPHEGQPFCIDGYFSFASYGLEFCV